MVSCKGWRPHRGLVLRPVSHLDCQRRSSRRAVHASGRRLRTPRRSGRGFNRLAVETALRRAAALWGRLVPAEFPNGALVFCSEALAEVVHPPKPLRRRVYSCGRHFDVTVLREQLEAERAPEYGIIVIGGSDAAIGTARGLGAGAHAAGCTVTTLARISSTAASRTRRGGQSALRYSRLREEADLAFLRRVAEKAQLLLQNVRALVLAGKADSKRRLLFELPALLRGKVICVLDSSYNAGDEGLRQAAFRAQSAASAEINREADEALCRFLERVAMPTTPSETQVCYGVAQTAAALRLGAVRTLLMAAGAPGPGGGPKGVDNDHYHHQILFLFQLWSA